MNLPDRKRIIRIAVDIRVGIVYTVTNITCGIGKRLIFEHSLMHSL